MGVIAGAAALALSVVGADAQTSFYDASRQEIAGRPGTLIRSEPMSFAPAGAQAYRVLYRSTGMHGEPIAVSGVIIVPPGPAPAGGRPVVAWAHPTTGVVPHCAPSLAIFVFQQMAGLRQLIEQGVVVAATDYPGLGTPGPHPYLVGDSEARAVIDSVRAARNLPGAETGNSFAVWGHSQGGQASLYSGLIARTYAPELNLVGVAAAAPATSLVTLMGDDFKTSGGKNLTAMTLRSWSRVYGAPINKVVLPEAMSAVDQLANECIESIFDILARRRTEKPLEEHFLSVPNIATVEPWRSLAARNTPGALPSSIPLFLAQGTTDDIVRPEVTASYMQRQCKAGSKVRMMWVQGVGHGFVARDSADAAVSWMMDRFAGRPAPTDCGKPLSSTADAQSPAQ
ncbi:MULTISPECIES: alpha/beta fold hydrolase [unclassified Bradyrhizobium]|uniref:alpha/beta fold hydrolase n=1 Tax=unclassified Bradyrhizobium TaxID=2631580 RepID=UPI0024790863|nr:MULTISPECIES: alpha/beta fold hydrolase [unclassified Bradyrhizobium]WGR73817.1 lipase family protein [Bradyrhizobium sp. ISRA426]WGR78654.1 lipase family protein [Bradyrhizobium sp. ISRA430]WGR89056.1 lipase family protein [Bradyrhizobium sp. ISRA432]